VMAAIRPTFMDLDQTYRPIFLYPSIPSLPLPNFSIAPISTILSKNAHYPWWPARHALSRLCTQFPRQSEHRYYPPDSIILDDRLLPHVIAYGLIKMRRKSESPETIRRSHPEFRAPEISHGSRPSAQADVLAVAVLLQRLRSDSVSFTPPKSVNSPAIVSRKILKLDRRSQTLHRIARGSVLSAAACSRTTEQAEIASDAMRSSGDAQQCDPMEPGEGSRPLFSSEAMKTMPATKRSSR
jgi:hypothetical protein